jgi:Icc-related predicted phosphoesterase
MDAKQLDDEPGSPGRDPVRRSHQSLTADDGVLARFDRPRASVPATVALVSDPHVSTDETGSWKLFHRTRERFRATIEDLEGEGVDCLAIAGDLTKDGARRDLDWIESALDDLAVPCVTVPGNHDVKEVRVAEFENRFTSAGLPVHRRIGGVDLIGLNSASTPEGGAEAREKVVSEAQLEWLERTLPETTAPVVVTHHNLPGLDDALGDADWDPHSPVENAEALIDVLSRHDVPLHLSGHVHLLGLTRNEGVRGLIAPALSSFPQSYLLLEVDGRGTTVRCRTPTDEAQLEEAYREAQSDSTRSEVVSELTVDALANLPIADEWSESTEE